MNGEFFLTFDIDWVPDFILRDVHGLVKNASLASTWFITHDSEAVQELKNDLTVELGLHPNYLPGSSHGATQADVLKYLLNIAPNAVSVRSHAVVQSGPILNYYVEQTNIRLDSTIFLPEQAGIVPVNYFLPSGVLTRVPFFWADDYELCRPQPDWNPARYENIHGLKVIMFHPIHVFLNSPDYAFYTELKKTHPNIGALTYEEALALRNTTRPGARDFLLQLLQMLSGQSTRTLNTLLHD